MRRLGARQQVDPRCLKPNMRCTLAQQWLTIPIDELGNKVEMLPLPLAIAALLFHPKNWGGMEQRAEELHVPSTGARVWAHPFSCDEALRCQAEVDAKPREAGVTNLLVGGCAGDDKTDVERMASAHAVHLKLLNTALAEWFERQSKVLLALLPIYKRDEDDQPLDNTRAAQQLYQRALSLLLVLLEVCARKGILMRHKYARQGWFMPFLLQSYAWHMPVIM